MTTPETPASVDGGPDHDALKECGRRILRWREQHGDETCAILRLAEKMLQEVIAPALQARPSTRDAALREEGYILAAAHLLIRAYDERTSEATAEVLKSAAASVRALAGRPTTPTPDTSQGSAPVARSIPSPEDCPGCAKVARHPGEGYSCAWHLAAPQGSPLPGQAVPRGHCERCERCGWELSEDRGRCRPGDCSFRPMPPPRTHCAGCGAVFDDVVTPGNPPEGER